MRDFLEPQDLPSGLTWTALYKGHEWARRGLFYFLITLRRGEQTTGQLLVEVDDRGFGDPTCTLSEAEVLAHVCEELQRLAEGGESNTSVIT